MSLPENTIFKSFNEIKDDLSFNQVIKLAEYGYNARIELEGGIIDDDS